MRSLLCMLIIVLLIGCAQPIEKQDPFEDCVKISLNYKQAQELEKYLPDVNHLAGVIIVCNTTWEDMPCVWVGGNCPVNITYSEIIKNYKNDQV